MPARVNNTRAADQLRREYGVMGDRLNLQVDDVVVPVAIVSDLTAGSGGIPKVRRAYASFYQAAVVAEYTTFRLEVPAGFIAVVNRLLVVTASTQVRVHWGSSFAAPANLGQVQYMDGRLREEDGVYPGGRLAYGTQVAALAAPFRYTIPNAELPIEWIFGRTDAYDFLEFQCAEVNEQAAVSMEWDEVTGI